MDRAIIVKFPDGFKFPEYFGQKNIQGDEWRSATFFASSCSCCPLCAGDDELYCLLTCDYEGIPKDKRHTCPFLEGSNFPILEN